MLKCSALGEKLTALSYDLNTHILKTPTKTQKQENLKFFSKLMFQVFPKGDHFQQSSKIKTKNRNASENNPKWKFVIDIKKAFLEL